MVASGVSARMPDGRYKIVRTFLLIDTDEGVTGMAGPVSDGAPALYIENQIKPLIMGQDPMATELLWDQMYRHAVSGHKGDNMVAISAVDNALWDIKGKYLGQPVYKLLGGPMRDKIPAYVSASGYSLEPDKVKERVRTFKQQGYSATKWFIRLGPTDGPEGIRKNIAIVKAAREAAGEDMDIMLDAWNSWDVPYTLKMAELLKEYRPAWIEEPVFIDLPKSYAYLRAHSPIPIAGGEHEYTRWGFKQLMDINAIDIYQPDAIWAGGISEVMKICTIASAYDVKVIPHGGSVQVNANISFALNCVMTPLMEYLIVRNEATQFFFKNPYKPVDGHFILPTAPGIGIELDESKIESERYLG